MCPCHQHICISIYVYIKTYMIHAGVDRILAACNILGLVIQCDGMGCICSHVCSMDSQETNFWALVNQSVPPVLAVFGR